MGTARHDRVVNQNPPAPKQRHSIHGLAASQFGLLTRDDLLAADVSAQAIRRRVRNGELEELLPGVFRVPGVPESWHQRLLAALRWAGDSCASHRSAAALLELDGFPQGPVEITTTRSRRPRNRIVLHRVGTMAPSDLMKRGPFTLTTPARTLLDLGVVCPLEQVELALEDVLRRKLTTIRALRWELRTQGGQGRAGTANLRALLEHRPDDYRPTASRLELEVDRVLRSHRFPSYERQHELETRLGLLHPDFAFPTYCVAVEADSYRWHSGRRSWQADKARMRALKAIGWDVVSVTWEDVTQRSDEFIADLQETLRRAGWEGAS